LEKILPVLRTHDALITLDLGTDVPADDIPTGPVAPPSKKKKGGQKNAFRWTSRCSFAARKGGLSIFNHCHRLKLNNLDKNLKKMKDDLTSRVHLEEEAVDKQKINAQNRRIGLKKTPEQAKIESVKPTMFSDIPTEELTGMLNIFTVIFSPSLEIINFVIVTGLHTEKTNLAFTHSAAGASTRTSTAKK